jgi:hypothetical protein
MARRRRLRATARAMIGNDGPMVGSFVGFAMLFGMLARLRLAAS